MELHWEDVAGHEAQKMQLRTMLREHRLPHALLLTGPDGVGKKKLGHVLAAALLCEAEDGPCGHCASCRAMASGTHPDYLEVLPERTGRSAAVIRIDAIRSMQVEASRYPVLSKQRVVLIDDADCMNEAAENSLLKTLEEPEGAVTFLLVTGARSSLLDTILSRCMPLSFGTVPEDAIVRALAQRGIAAEEAHELASLSDGSIGRAIALHEHEGLSRRDDALDFLAKLPQMDMTSVWKRSQEMGELDRETLSEWFLYLNMMLRDMLVLYEDGGSSLIYHKDVRARLLALLPSFPEPVIFSLLALVRETQHRLQSNVNLRLLMEGFHIRMRDVVQIRN